MTTLRERLSRWWLVRSLGTGLVGSILDHSVGVLCAMAGVPTRGAAMAGKVVGFTFGFFALRHFAFVDHRTSLWGSAVRFAAINFGISLIHGQVTVWLRDGQGVPYVLAAMGADMLVVTPLSLLANRYAVFPKHQVDSQKPPAAE